MPPIDVNANVTEIKVPCTGNRHGFVSPAAEALAKCLTTALQIPTLPVGVIEVRSVLGRSVGQDTGDALTQQAIPQVCEVRMDALPSQVQGGSEVSVRPDKRYSFRGEEGTSTTTDGYRAHSIGVVRTESQGVRCTAAVGNDRNNIEIKGIEKLDEIASDLTESTSRKAGGMTEAGSVHHDHTSSSSQRVGTSGDPRRRGAL